MLVQNNWITFLYIFIIKTFKKWKITSRLSHMVEYHQEELETCTQIPQTEASSEHSGGFILNILLREGFRLVIWEGFPIWGVFAYEGKFPNSN